MNLVELAGYLCADPVIYPSANGKVANYTIAINRFKEGTDFIPCVAFGRMAEHAEKNFKKGLKLIVTGRLESGSYVNKEGQKIYTVKVIVGTQEFAERKAISDQKSAERKGSVETGESPDVSRNQDSMDGCPFN